MKVNSETKFSEDLTVPEPEPEPAPAPTTETSPPFILPRSDWRNERIISVIVTVTVILLLILLILRDGKSAKKPGICQTKTCAAEGKRLFESINFTVNPCEDFYEFSCGNWIATNSKIDVLSSKTIPQRKVDQTIKDLIEHCSNSSSNLKHKSQAIQLALNFYHKCLDQRNDTQNELDVAALKGQVSQLLGISWPILKSSENMTNSSLIDTLARLQAIDASSIVHIYTSEHIKKEEAKTIRFGRVWYKYENDIFINQTANQTKIAAYRQYMHDAVSLFVGSQVDEMLLQTRLDEMFQLESQLVVALNQVDSYKDMKSLAELKNISLNKFDWTELLRQFTSPFKLSKNFTDEDQVCITHLSYYQKVAELLADTPRHVLYNYLGFRIIFYVADEATRQLRTMKLTLKQVMHGSNEHLAPFRNRCLDNVKEYFKYAIWRLYVDHQIVPKNIKKYVQEMVANVKSAFKHIAENESPWLDEISKAKVLEKADASYFKVAYPDWIRNNSQLDNFYNFGENFTILKNGRFVEYLFAGKQFEVATKFREAFNDPNVDIETWDYPLTRVGAREIQESNSVYLPAAYLQPPFFDADRPAYLNYGSIGYIIGHELTHLFDDKGRNYDKTGKIVDWWTEETRKRFDSKNRCFIEQYSSIVEKTTRLKLNGLQTLSDNLADSGGIREALYAFQTLAKNTKLQLVPQMEAFTLEQLFFISYGQHWCSIDSAKTVQYYINNGVHSPNRYRINVVLGNLNEFSSAFNCSPRSPMNPAGKCRLW